MNFDLIVIGSGPGGYVAAIRASQLGLKTAIIEKENLGGICLNWGCIPTKALLQSAKIFNYLKHSQDYGISTDNIKVDLSKIIARSRAIVNKMNSGLISLIKKNNITIIFGKAIIKPGKIINVIDNNNNIIEYSALHIIIAVGARSKILPNLPQDKNKIIGYKEALTLSKLPKSMIIVGAGAIGVEFAYFYNSLGTKVIILEYLNRILPLEDEDISKQLELVFTKKGLEIFTSSYIENININDKDQIKVNVFNNKYGTKHTLETEVILSAAGIIPNTENIGLEETGIKTKDGRIIVDEYYRTNIPGYYAIGDVIQGPALAHVASYEGITCVEYIKNLKTYPLNYNNIPNCTYCIPEIASVGYTEKQAIEKGYEIKIGKFFFNALGKAVADGNTTGFVKVIFDTKYGELLGCHMIGNGVTEIISSVVTARQLETTNYDIIKTIYPHPTMSEAIVESVNNAYDMCINM
ncbi:MAG: dihydrolipoyl dehydrogenase [Candidatus Bostrichicola ureolyticus]|nr:MAG: dihydrolipoyl dehydrogenase [Candidatus Bostrichicola ureolyticus]